MTDPRNSACGDFREDLPLLAVGKLHGEEKEALERHIAGCPACQADLQSHRRVLETVRKESGPEVPLDSTTVLNNLRKLVAEEARERAKPAVQSPAPPREKPRTPWTNLIVAVLLVTGLILLATNYQRFLPVAPPPPPPTNPADLTIAKLQPVSGESEPHAVSAGETRKPGPNAELARYAQGLDVLLDPATQATFTSATKLDLLSGRAAVYVPAAEHPDFEVHTATGAVRAKGTLATRYVAVLAKGRLSVAVLEGSVDLVSADGHTLLELNANEQSYVEGQGFPAKPEPAAPDAFSWVNFASNAGLKLTLRAVPGLKPRVIVRLENTGTQKVRISEFHPLHANYWLESRRKLEKSFAATKLDPIKLRRTTPGVDPDEREASGAELELEPGQGYEIEGFFRPMEAKKGEFVVAADYNRYGEQRPVLGGWGGFLRSEEIEITWQP